MDNPGAVLEDAGPKADDWIEFVQSKDGQKQFAKYGYRPLVDVGDIEVEGANDPKNPFPEPKKLLTIDDFGAPFLTVGGDGLPQRMNLAGTSEWTVWPDDV